MKNSENIIAGKLFEKEEKKKSPVELKKFELAIKKSW